MRAVRGSADRPGDGGERRGVRGREGRLDARWEGGGGGNGGRRGWRKAGMTRDRREGWAGGKGRLVMWVGGGEGRRERKGGREESERGSVGRWWGCAGGREVEGDSDVGGNALGPCRRGAGSAPLVRQARRFDAAIPLPLDPAATPRFPLPLPPAATPPPPEFSDSSSSPATPRRPSTHNRFRAGLAAVGRCRQEPFARPAPRPNPALISAPGVGPAARAVKRGTAVCADWESAARRARGERIDGMATTTPEIRNRAR